MGTTTQTPPVPIISSHVFPLRTEALVVHEPKGNFTLTEITLDEVRADELLVEIKYSGLCHTDIVVQQGLLPNIEFPAVLGHEGAGIVRQVGSQVRNKSIREGDHVLLSYNHCGQCKQCTSGHPAYCHNHGKINHGAVRPDGSTPGKMTADGRSVRSQYYGQSSFSRMSVVNEKCVVKCPYPDNLSVYAPLGCGFQTGAGTILNVLKPSPEQSVVVCGIGSVGLTAVMAAKYAGVKRVIAIDLFDERLKLAQDLGATHVINSKIDPSTLNTIRRLTDGGADYAIDCTGVCSVIEMLIECVGPRGTAATVGIPPPGKKIEVDPLAFLVANKTYTAITEGDSEKKEFIPKLMELHRAGHFPIERLCKVYPLAELEQALNDIETGTVIKPIIEF